MPGWCHDSLHTRASLPGGIRLADPACVEPLAVAGPAPLVPWQWTSQVSADREVGRTDSGDYIPGANRHRSHTRCERLNMQPINVDGSQTRIAFGYCRRGMVGLALTVGTSFPC